MIFSPPVSVCECATITNAQNHPDRSTSSISGMMTFCSICLKRKKEKKEKQKTLFVPQDAQNRVE